MERTRSWLVISKRVCLKESEAPHCRSLPSADNPPAFARQRPFSHIFFVPWSRGPNGTTPCAVEVDMSPELRKKHRMKGVPLKHKVTPVPPESHPRRCSAKSKRSGQQCRRWALSGLATCRSHGSANARSKRKAERTRAQARIGAFLSQQRILIGNVDPLEVLLYQLGWASGAARALGHLVSDLEEIHGPNHARDCSASRSGQDVERGEGQSCPTGKDGH